MSLLVQVIILSEFTTPKFQASRLLKGKKKPRKGVGMGKSRSKLHTTNSGAKYMSGIGDQTLDTAKGLEALPSDITIVILTSSLKMGFVNLCKPLKLKKPSVRMGIRN